LAEWLKRKKGKNKSAEKNVTYQLKTCKKKLKYVKKQVFIYKILCLILIAFIAKKIPDYEFLLTSFGFVSIFFPSIFMENQS
jgi:hypothetical protein